MSIERIRAAGRYFFETALTDRQRQELQQASDRADVRLGTWKRYSGAAVPVVGGGTVTPRFALEVGGTALTLTAGRPDLRTATVGAGTGHRAIVALEDRADIAQDDRREIARILHNLEAFAGAGRADAWATAVAGHADRASLATNLRAVSEVPQAFRTLAPDLAEYCEVLQHFFTFRPDGTYYARWSGSGRQAPGDLSDAYREANTRAISLRRDDVYVYGVVPTRWLDPRAQEPEGGGVGFREVVWGFRWGGDDQATPRGLRVLHTVDVPLGEAAAFHDLVVFYAEDGDGLAVPEAARRTLRHNVVDLLAELPEDAQQRRHVLAESPQTTNETDPRLKIIARVRGNPTFPAGVVAAGTGEQRLLLVPPDKVVEVGAMPDVLEMMGPRPVRDRTREAATMIKLPTLTGRIAADKRGGAGAVVGIIDSGLDAQHPAFAGRVLGVWDMTDATGPTPAANGVGSHVFSFDLVRQAVFGVGTEFTGATVTNARDSGAHGTHVAGIAAGAEVTGTNPVPPGMAPAARIVAVRRGSGDGSDFDVLRAFSYIQDKAAAFDADAPVVINMSFGHHDHAHDGTDALSRTIDGMVMVADSFSPGLIPVAAAGNERDDGIHIGRTVAASSEQVLAFRFRDGLRAWTPYSETVTLWVTNPTTISWWLSADVRARRPAPSTVATAAYSLSWWDDTRWETKYGAGMHIGVTFGMADPQNNDFNIRVQFETARAVVPDPAGPLTIAGNSYKRVNLARNGWLPSEGRFFTWSTDFKVPLGRTTPWASDSAAFTSLINALNPLVVDQWEVVLGNRGSRPLDVHGWFAREGASFTGLLPSDASHLLCAPADARSVICVASVNSTLSWNDAGGNAVTRSSATNVEGGISYFSSPGPLRKQPSNPGVDITAPGAYLLAARSQNDVTGGNTANTINAQGRMMQGTSMASPCAAGAIANIMAEEPRLTVAHIRTRLEQCSIPTTLKDGTTAMPATLPTGANDWGKGLLDADKLKASTP